MSLGEFVKNWSPPKPPNHQPIAGKYCVLEPLACDKHSVDLFEAYQLDRTGSLWAYLPYGPFADLPAYQQWLTSFCVGSEPMFFSIVDKQTSRALGVASYLRINPAAGSIEVGHINYSPLLQNTVMATEAMYLLMKQAFALGYRRYEWKCNALNQASRSAARRLGFSYEGTFRQMMVVKGRNRDTAWYSIIDREWPARQAVFQTWLSSDNFTADGRQRRALSELMDAKQPHDVHPSNA